MLLALSLLPLAPPAAPLLPPACTNLTGLWTDGGPHPQSNTRIEQNGSTIRSFGSYGDGVGSLEGLTIGSMAFHTPPTAAGAVPPTQSAILTPDCADFWFCGSVEGSPSAATCKGAHWVRGSSKNLPPAPAPPGPPPPPPPPGTAVQELTEFATDKCVGRSALQGTWPYGTCSALVPAAVPGFIASGVGSVKATLGPAPHENVTFALFSDGACATALPATEATMTVTLNACVPGEKSLGNPTTFSRFQGHASAPSEQPAGASAAGAPCRDRFREPFSSASIW